MIYLKPFHNFIFEGFLGLFLVPDPVAIKYTETMLSILNRGYLNRESVIRCLKVKEQKGTLPSINSSGECSILGSQGPGVGEKMTRTSRLKAELHCTGPQTSRKGVPKGCCWRLWGGATGPAPSAQRRWGLKLSAAPGQHKENRRNKTVCLFSLLAVQPPSVAF